MLLAAALAAAAAWHAVAAGVAPERIALTARKFQFGVDEIRVPKGRPVTLVLTTEDFAHGFSLPDFKLRADFVPGKTVEITFTPDRAGRFTFLCDNFCGDDHDAMSGYLVVTDD